MDPITAVNDRVTSLQKDIEKLNEALHKITEIIELLNEKDNEIVKVITSEAKAGESNESKKRTRRSIHRNKE